MTKEQVEEILVESNPEALFFDGFDDAIIGVAERINFGPVVAYDKDKIIEIIAKDMEPDSDDLDGRELEDVKIEMAMDYFYYNVAGSFLGEGTPIIITTNL